ncbi:MAG: TonB-dependent receptor [Flavobacteriales bacterium]|nr:TonB-dependent receptor [Flavobacteriales bacterium]|tara:strand:+ start:1484 stop:3541 length:2058 start_codon:yes stop_codon:yes gene_type:complete
MKKILFITIAFCTFINAQNKFKTDSIQQLEEINLIYKASELTPVTYQNISLEEIKLKSIGQEPSLFLSNFPSIVSHTDCGYSQGYSYFRLRGIDQTRINITLDGVPLNDPADQAFYFSNFADILNSISSIQIQRGVGTSKNGSASYAGSIELFTPILSSPKELAVGIDYGSFNTMRAYSSYNSGLKDTFLGREYSNFKTGSYMRFSKIMSNGFKQHSSNNSHSLFYSGGIFKDKSIWKINYLLGQQKNELAWMAVSEGDINCDRTFNANSEFEKDNFTQQITQLQNTLMPTKQSTIKSSFYHVSADGWWDFDLPNYYGFESTTDDVSRNTVKSNLIGLYSNYNFNNEKINITSGFHVNSYTNNFTESHMNSGEIWNENTKYKKEISLFQKTEYKLNSLLLFYDLQYRKSWFNYSGNIDFNEITWSFSNPKIGISFKLRESSILYANIGKTGREPSRYDMFYGNDVLSYLAESDSLGNLTSDSGNELISGIEPEKVTDFEIGFRHNSQKLDFNINYYLLDFKNERVLNGAYGPNGLALTSNVEKSSRTGIELNASYKVGKYITLVNNSSYNYSIIKEKNVEFIPILSPPFIINQEVIIAKNKFTVSLNTRYQSNSYINFENTESINEYILLNGSINYQLIDLHITLFINNITDNFYFNNGIVDWDGSNKYFVQAPRNYHISLKYIF